MTFLGIDRTLHPSLDEINFLQAGTGAVQRDAQSKMRDAIHVADFGAVGDGVTDDLTPLTNFINEVLASESKTGVLGDKIYAISGALPSINDSAVRIIGAGYSVNHDVGSMSGTIIRAITNTGFTMLTVAPTEGASAQYLSGLTIKGIAFEANSKAAKGVVMKSIRYSDIDVAVTEATTTGFELNVATTLGEATSLQFNRIRYVGRQTANAAVSLRLIGTAAGNPSFNFFEQVDIVHKDEIGIIEENADNNWWGSVRVFQAAGGAATNSIEWRGGATSGTSCRAEYIDILTATVAPIAKGTGVYTVGAQNIQIRCLDKDNNTPDPTVEVGATTYWQNSSTPHYDEAWTQTTPTPTAGTGAFETVSSIVRAKRVANGAEIHLIITITSNGTAASFISVALPYTTANVGVGSVFIGRNTGTGVAVIGRVGPNSSTMAIQRYDGAYSGATGQAIELSGFIEI